MFITRQFQQLKKTVFIIAPLILLSIISSAQGLNNLDLARQYESTGEFDKAAVFYEKQYNIDPFGTYEPYLKCLKQIKDYKEAEKLIKKQAKRGAGAGKYNVDLGLLYEMEGDTDKAKNLTNPSNTTPHSTPSLEGDHFTSTTKTRRLDINDTQQIRILTQQLDKSNLTLSQRRNEHRPQNPGRYNTNGHRKRSLTPNPTSRFDHRKLPRRTPITNLG